LIPIVEVTLAVCVVESTKKYPPVIEVPSDVADTPLFNVLQTTLPVKETIKELAQTSSTEIGAETLPATPTGVEAQIASLKFPLALANLFGIYYLFIY
jgi:hypothetical protein